MKEGGKFEYGIGDGNYHDCDSLDDGKAKCKAHYRSRLAAALEPLIAKEVGA